MLRLLLMISLVAQLAMSYRCCGLIVFCPVLPLSLTSPCEPADTCAASCCGSASECCGTACETGTGREGPQEDPADQPWDAPVVCCPRDSWREGPQPGPIDTIHPAMLLPAALPASVQCAPRIGRAQIDLVHPLSGRGGGAHQALLQVWLI
jgi:hypothetical protein